jgi:hypothetical protein
MSDTPIPACPFQPETFQAIAPISRDSSVNGVPAAVYSNRNADDHSDKQLVFIFETIKQEPGPSSADQTQI